MIVALLAAGCSQPAASAPGAPACIDNAAAIAAAKDAAAQLQVWRHAFVRGDVGAEAAVTRRAAADYQALASATTADPAISTAAQAAANDLRAYAREVRLGDPARTRELDAATAAEQSAGTAISRTAVPPC